jgi:nucleoside 2-deoxyribosyltransferase
MNEAMHPTIYLAGFDVFRPDAADQGRWLKRLCAERSLNGLFPLDGVAPSGLSKQDTARWIYQANVSAIQQADAVMANLNDFRGPGEPDSGTAFEVGFAVALGKPVWGYRAQPDPLIERVPALHSAEGTVCHSGYLVEDFGMPVNLMLAVPAHMVFGGPEACLDVIASHFRHMTR